MRSIIQWPVCRRVELSLTIGCGFLWRISNDSNKNSYNEIETSSYIKSVLNCANYYYIIHRVILKEILQWINEISNRIILEIVICIEVYYIFFFCNFWNVTYFIYQIFIILSLSSNRKFSWFQMTINILIKTFLYICH